MCYIKWYLERQKTSCCCQIEAVTLYLACYVLHEVIFGMSEDFVLFPTEAVTLYLACYVLHEVISGMSEDFLLLSNRSSDSVSGMLRATWSDIWNVRRLRVVFKQKQWHCSWHAMCYMNWHFDCQRTCCHWKQKSEMVQTKPLTQCLTLYQKSHTHTYTHTHTHTHTYTHTLIQT